MKKVSTDALMQKIKSGDDHFRIVDVLSRESYAYAHIPGAIHIPLEDLKKRAPKEIPKDLEVVVYCSSPT